MVVLARCREGRNNMTLTEKFISDAIHIDFGGEILYGSDQVFDTNPVRFPTVEFILKATDVLVEIADHIRFILSSILISAQNGGVQNFKVTI